MVVVATKWNFAPIRCQNHKGRTNVNKSDMSHMRIMTLTRFQNRFENLVRNCISNRFVGAEPNFRCEQYGGTWKALDGGEDEAPDRYVESGEHSEATARGQAER